jgi:membrane protein required for beta-lactamase induction
MPWHYTCDPTPNALAGIDAPARQCVDHMLDMRCADELTGSVALITNFAKLLNHWNEHLAFLGSAALAMDQISTCSADNISLGKRGNRQQLFTCF